jgi:hypothetical protein
MKVNLLETHDRLKHLKKEQSINIFHGAEDCLKHNEDSLFFQDHSPYVYLFAHPRTEDNGSTKVMYWQPRLWKPKAQSNSFLFRAISKTDIIEVCWLIPAEELWQQYLLGNITEHELVLWSIGQYCHNRGHLEKDHPDDLSNEQGKRVMQALIAFKREKSLLQRIYNVD